MSDLIVHYLNVMSYIAAFLIILVGGLFIVAIFFSTAMYMLNYVYKQMKATVYFVSFIRHRKEFIKWYKETKPNVYQPKLKNNE